MTLQLNVLPENGHVRTFYQNHKAGKPGDSGVDLFVPEDTIVKGNALGQKINLKIKCELVSTTDTKSKHSYLLIPRSSLIKTPLRQSNSVGLIDSNYTGNIQFPVDNLSGEDYTVEKGTRLCQVVGPNLDQNICCVIVESIEETERGDGGFGSTGK